MVFPNHAPASKTNFKDKATLYVYGITLIIFLVDTELDLLKFSRTGLGSKTNKTKG